MVICPVKDESWILEEFLKAASLFADHIVVLDHNSTDQSREIAKRFPKVDLFLYSGDGFDENSRRRLLLERARRFGSGNAIFALDADEFLTLEILSDKVQQMIHTAPEGTRFRVPLANVRPGFKEYWTEKMDPIVLIDDGSDFDHDNEIHFPRLPVSKVAEVRQLPEVYLMHLQYVDWNRMLSKKRWYMAWERINYPKKSVLKIIRRYNHMNVIHPSQLSLIPVDWLSQYETRDVHLGSLAKMQQSYRWDEIVKDWVGQGKVRDWFLLFSEQERDAMALSLSARQASSLSRLKCYLQKTDNLYHQRRFLVFRIALRVLDEAASFLIFSEK